MLGLTPIDDVRGKRFPIARMPPCIWCARPWLAAVEGRAGGVA